MPPYKENYMPLMAYYLKIFDSIVPISSVTETIATSLILETS